jgi:Cohesin domain
MRLRLFVVIAFVLYALPAGALPILSINPSDPNVDTGDTFSVEVVISDAEDLFAFQLDLGFNPDPLSALTVEEGAFLGSGGPTFFVPGGIDNAGGFVGNTANTLLGAVGGVSGDGVLAIFTFRAVGAGVSPITLFNATLLDSSLSSTPFTVQNGLVRVTAVADESSTLPLLVVGLLYLFWRSHTVGRTWAPRLG